MSHEEKFNEGQNFFDCLFSPKIIAEEKTGRLIAEVPIFVDEIIVRWDGKIVQIQNQMELDAAFQLNHTQVDDDYFLEYSSCEENRNIPHSCSPNTGFQGSRTLVAMRPIKKGEFISRDFAMSETKFVKEIPCGCGTAECRKLLKPTDWCMPQLLKKYAGFYSPYLQKKITSL